VNGNFTRVNRQGGGDRIRVEGWLSWDPAEQGAEAELSISVTQNTVTATGSGHAKFGDAGWQVDIDLNGDTFSQGIASGVAGAVVTIGNSSTSQSWLSGPIPVN
jgi:autotransporter translocation and assembly factor TamB